MTKLKKIEQIGLSIILIVFVLSVISEKVMDRTNYGQQCKEKQGRLDGLFSTGECYKTTITREKIIINNNTINN